MSGNEVRLTNGQRWTARQFLDHYFQPSGSGSPVPVAGPPSPVSIDMSWYMSEGPGRFYHPGLFPVIDKILENRTLAPGTYNLLDFVPNRDPKDTSLSAKISNYSTNPLSTDYKTRALVFGDESATILVRSLLSGMAPRRLRRLRSGPGTPISTFVITMRGFILNCRAGWRERSMTPRATEQPMTSNIVDRDGLANLIPIAG